MSCLSFLGLSEKAGRLVTGEESCGMAARAKKARVILLASDAGRSTQVRGANYAETGDCPLVRLPFTRNEVGAALGRGAVSMAAVTDIGLAAAFVDKLSAENPGAYEDPAAELQRTLTRAMERKKEAKRHKENVRRGKSKR